MSGIPKIKYPITYQDLAEFGKDGMYFSGTWDEYTSLLEIAEYNLEFHENTIYTLSIASDPHETITSNIIGQLIIHFLDNADFVVKGSSRPVFIKKYQKSYIPDVHIVKGQPIFHTITKGLTANTNPWLVVEVLSPSTENKDWSKKLPYYKKISSLKHIIYVEQERPYVSVFSRKGKTETWENKDYDDLNDAIFIDKTLSIPLKRIYNKILLKNS